MTDHCQHRAIALWKQNNFGVHIDMEEPAGRGEMLGHGVLVDLCFADDQTLVARNVDDLQEMLDTVVKELAKMGLSVRASKTEWMGIRILALVPRWVLCAQERVYYATWFNHTL